MMAQHPARAAVLDDILFGADEGEVAVDEHMVRPGTATPAPFAGGTSRRDIYEGTNFSRSCQST